MPNNKLKADDDFYCVRCREKCKGNDIKLKKFKNGRYGLQGICSKCDNTTVTRFVSNSDVERLKSKYS
jgi:hypothetical protein